MSRAGGRSNPRIKTQRKKKRAKKKGWKGSGKHMLARAKDQKKEKKCMTEDEISEHEGNLALEGDMGHGDL